jgi:hypothetical protein
MLDAVEENLCGHLTLIPRHRAGMVVEDREDLLLVDSGLPNESFNQVAAVRLAEERADGRIREAVDYFRAAGRPFTWRVGPLRPQWNLEGRLEEHGLRAVKTAAVMLAGAEEGDGAAEGIEVRRVRSVAELATFCQVMAEAWEPPDPSVGVYYSGSAPVLLRENCPLRLLVGYVKGQPAGAGEWYGNASLGAVYRVMRRARYCGRGVRAAVVRAAVREAREVGLERVLLVAPESEQERFARLGFEPVCRITGYQ